MSEVKRYHLTEAGLVEGVSLGRLNVVLAADYEAAVEEIAKLKRLNALEQETVTLALNTSTQIVAERAELQRLLDHKEQQRESELRNGQAGDRLVGELQQRLTAADELVCERTASLLECGTRRKALEQRVDVLEGQLSKLSDIGSLIRSQDNRCTDRPMFAVMEKRSIPTLDTHDHDRIDWVETETGDYCLADETTARRLEALHRGHRDTPGWERYAMKDIDVFVTACFTEQGCKDFLARDGHNHRSPFIYAFGSYRNSEYQTVREFLKSLPEIVKP